MLPTCCGEVSVSAIKRTIQCQSHERHCANNREAPLLDTDPAPAVLIQPERHSKVPYSGNLNE